MEQFDALDQEERILRYLFDNVTVQNNVLPYLKEEYFQSKHLQPIVKNILKFNDAFGKYPTPREFYSRMNEGKMRDDFVKVMKTPVDATNPEEISQLVERFLQIRMTLSCLQDQIQAITEGDTDAVAGLIEPMAEAVNFKLESDIGYDIEDDVEEVLRKMLETAGSIPSSLQFLNDKTKARTTSGGWYKKALSIVLGEAGVGKSLVMCNEAAYAYRCGYNVLYISLELSAEVCFQRIAANLTDINYKDIEVGDVSMVNEHAVTIRKAMNDNKINEGGWMSVTDLASGTTALDIDRLICQTELKRGELPDLVVVDYIGEMGANGATSNMKRPELLANIARQLRNIARKRHVAVLTGSQINRDGYGSTSDVGMKNTSDSAGLNHVSDLLVTITQDEVLRLRTMYCHKIIKNRMGPKNDVFFSKVFWEYMRVKDCTPEELSEYTAELVTGPQETTGNMGSSPPQGMGKGNLEVPKF
jgi:replicative DNA helicase